MQNPFCPPSLRPPTEDHPCRIMLPTLKIPTLPPEVYHKITTYLDLPTLKSFRLSSRPFYHLATSTFHSRGSSLHFVYKEFTNNFIPTQYHKNPVTGKISPIEYSLHDLINLLQNSVNFPCIRLNLIQIPHVTPDIIAFTEQYGHLLRSLSFKIFNGQPTLLKDIPRLLLHFPHLTHLELWNSKGKRDTSILEIESSSDKHESSLTLHSLTSLTLFRYDDYDPLVREILNAAPNLQICTPIDHQGLSRNLINLLMDTRKVYTLKNLRVNSAEVEPYEIFARFKPSLTRLTLNLTEIGKKLECWTRVSKILTELFKESRNSLERIHLESPIGFLAGLEWPQFSSCHQLYIDVNSVPFPPNSLILPYGLELSKIFPSLTAVTFDFWYLENLSSNSNLPLPLIGQLQSVRKLELFCRNYHSNTPYPMTWMEGLPHLFPNLQEFHIKLAVDLNNLRTIFKIFCGGSIKLKSLCLEILNHCEVNVLDSAFTGLRRNGKRKGVLLKDRGEDLEVPTLMSLCELRNLTVIFGEDQKWDQGQGNNFVLSEISGLHAFTLMPELRVKVIAVSQNVQMVEAGLCSIAPYVDLQIKPG